MSDLKTVSSSSLPNWVSPELLAIDLRLPRATPNRSFFDLPLPRVIAVSFLNIRRRDDWVLCQIYQKSRHHSPVDREQEDDAGAKSFASSNKIHKSFSVSEFLVKEADLSLLGLLETPMNAPLTHHDPMPNSNSNLNNSFSNNIGNSDGNRYITQPTESHASFLAAEQSLKRHRTEDDCYFDDFGGQPSPSKKFRNSNIFAQFYNHFDISQPFFNQQLQRNSHLGMQ